MLLTLIKQNFISFGCQRHALYIPNQNNALTHSPEALSLIVKRLIAPLTIASQ